MVERRTTRSENPHKALCHQLEHTRIRGGLQAMVLAMRNGLLVASAGDHQVCEELGAVAPLMCRSVFSMAMPERLHDGEIVVRSLRLNGEDLYIAGLGGGMARDALLRHSMHGVERILQAN